VRTKEDIKKARDEINRARYLKKQQQALQLQITNMPDPLKFVDQKNTAVDLKNSVKNWERKIEIAEVAAKKSRVILRGVGEHVEEIERPDYLLNSHHAGGPGSDEEMDMEYDN
jgi:hypothetical protein